jgi:hypothetical protein
MNIAIWHCYWYGPYETIVLLAETQELLEAKVRQAIAEGWYPEDQGPIPDDWRDDGEISRGQRRPMLFRRLGLYCHRRGAMRSRPRKGLTRPRRIP